MNSKTHPFGFAASSSTSSRSPLARFQSLIRHPLVLWLGVFLANALVLSLLLWLWTWTPAPIPWGDLHHWHPVILSAVLCLNWWAWPRLHR